MKLVQLDDRLWVDPDAIVALFGRPARSDEAHPGEPVTEVWLRDRAFPHIAHAPHGEVIAVLDALATGFPS